MVEARRQSKSAWQKATSTSWRSVRKVGLRLIQDRASTNSALGFAMPSFDIVSEIDTQEIDNALNQARKELATRFDLKDAKTEIIPEQDKIILIADDASRLRGLREIVIGKLSK